MQNITLAQPTKVGLVWLVPTGSAVPSQEAQRKMAEKIKAQFTAGKRLEIIGTAILPVSQGDLLSDIRKASAPMNVPHVLVVMPNGNEVVSPEWLYYGREGSAVGTRTDIFMTVSLVGLDLASGKSLFFVVANGEARLLATKYEDARPFYPSISSGRTSAFIYLPFEHSEALEDQERACALCAPLRDYPETDDAHRYAFAHRDIIRRFGRFPHRNAILGRASTAQELEFLKQPGSSF